MLPLLMLKLKVYKVSPYPGPAKYLDHMLVNFEQNRLIRHLQNLTIFPFLQKMVWHHFGRCFHDWNNRLMPDYWPWEEYYSGNSNKPCHEIFVHLVQYYTLSRDFGLRQIKLLLSNVAPPYIMLLDHGPGPLHIVWTKGSTLICPN